MARKALMTPIRVILPALLLPLLSACVADGPAMGVATGDAQPAMATWRCDGGGRMTVRRVGETVQVSSPRGVDVTLPASPPGSRERYGEGLYAVVFNGREALWFVTGKPPLNCRR